MNLWDGRRRRWARIMEQVERGEDPGVDNLWAAIRLYGVPPISSASKYVAEIVRPPRGNPHGAPPKVLPEDLPGLLDEFEELRAKFWEERRLIKKAGRKPSSIAPAEAAYSEIARRRRISRAYVPKLLTKARRMD